MSFQHPSFKDFVEASALSHFQTHGLTFGFLVMFFVWFFFLLLREVIEGNGRRRGNNIFQKTEFLDKF